MSDLHVMVDIETLGTKPGSVILSIGAVKFSEIGGILDKFYRRIDLMDATLEGLVMDVATVKWWMEQDGAARKEALKNGDKLESVLFEFDAWMDQEACVWGNSAAFDLGLLGAAYEIMGMDVPWDHRKERCYRTVKALFPGIGLERDETWKHHALADAEYQARHLLMILDALLPIGRVMEVTR